MPSINVHSVYLQGKDTELFERLSTGLSEDGYTRRSIRFIRVFLLRGGAAGSDRNSIRCILMNRFAGNRVI